ncbi:hypothetical protein SAMN05421781_0301 [Marinococcus luteus]|uniref:Uncharacterized protein n=1 Tax=Marinococcus luteus TaxID=1122204 RepID=A0A1H2QGB7_9BACI|nr:hypothetical protein [Marinococcus luteus]SDW05990.1 hypothetical protein SAMN05421781_0301 [Marinococcus luteus]
MKWNKLNKQDAELIFNQWKNSAPKGEPASEEEEKLRNKLLSSFNLILSELNIEKEELNNKFRYQFDLEFGLSLYKILNSYKSFTQREAGDNDIWRYMSIYIIPDVIYYRFGFNESRYWKNSSRLSLKVMWWYVHLSWQGTEEETRKILKGNNTDDIAQLVERAGPEGYRPEFARELMKYYGSNVKKFKSRDPFIFRKVMRLNTAKVETMEPGLHPGGEVAYVRELFKFFKL